MTYGQIISILFVALLCYYAFLIVMDIQRAKAAEAAEQDNHVEEDIDISDEAQSFRPHKVSREEPKKEEESLSENTSPTQSDADTSQEGKEEVEDEQEESDNSEDVYNEIESGIAASSQSSDDETTDEPAEEESEEPADEQASEESTDDNSDEEQPEDDDQPFRSPTYREAILTDGILVDDIFKAIDQLAETGECDLGTIIYHCESMRYAG